MASRKLPGLILLAVMLAAQAVPRAQAAAICDQAQFVSDLSAPDGSSFAPGAAFTKTWRFMNAGTCPWTTSYSIIFVGGDAMSAPASVRLPVNVAPGQMLDISINLTAPTTTGHYRGLWKFSNASGAQFGIGASGTDAFWVDINIVENKSVIYDFVANAPYAQWKSGAGPLPFPGASGDYRGYSLVISNPHLEDDSFDTSPGLLTVPQNKYNGYIQAVYPEIQLQQGDTLQTLVNCEFGATGCYITFRIDYLTATGAQKTLWSWKEAYEKRFYRASIDLSPLAGQKVRFVFLLLSSGLANNDRAIWGSPRIVRTGATQPPAPPPTLTLLPPLTPTTTPIAPPPTIQPSGCDRASFVTDVTIADGTIFTPGASFTKTWRLKNSGSCTWTTAYRLTYYSGEQMGAPTAINLPWSVTPGQTIDLTVNLIAPAGSGTYRGYWILGNANGQFFGIGTDALKPFWVEINVAGEAPYEEGYKFWLNTCSAEWRSGAGALPCPGTEGDNKGFILPQNFSHLEDGTMGPAPSLLMSPENKYNGYIQGIYPTLTVQTGDRFRTAVGCEYGYSCYVTFRLDYMTPNGGIFNFWSWREQSDRKNYSVDVDLSPLAGRSVRFILTILATGSSTGDRVRWGGPTLIRRGDAVPATPLPPPTITPTPGMPIYSPNIRSLHMIDPLNGWALSDLHILRTYDGGATWYNALFESLPVGGFFPSFSKGWVISNYADAGAGSLYRTTNGGVNWTRYDVPFNSGYIQFVDDNTGYVLQITGAAMNKQSVALYKTVDGGTTWMQNYNNDPTIPGAGNTLPLGGHKNGMTFSNATTGWVGGDIPINGSIYLYKTTDSGVTWTQQSLPIPAGYQNAYMTTSAPKFLGANDAILPVWMTLGAGMRDLYLYITHDGGATWMPSPAFARNAEHTEIITMNNVIGWDWANLFHVTSNSGNNWTTITPNIKFGDGFRELDFVSATTGWARLQLSDGHTALYRTTDGGYTWTLISGHQPDLPTPTPTPSPISFAQSVVDALNARNFDFAKASMDQTFATGYWGSQGTASTPDQAIEAFRTTYLGTTPLTSDAAKDLTALLGGLNPYGIMGLDPAKAYALFVSGFSGWGADGKSEAILYFTRRADGSLFWFGMLIAPVGFGYTTPTSTPAPTITPSITPAALIGPYAVVNVAASDVLNIRSGAGVSQPIIGFYPPDATDIMETGAKSTVDGAVWVEVRRGVGLTGWVNSFYLTEYVTHEAFCADSRILPIIEQVKQSMSQSNGGLLAPWVSPIHGVNMHLWAYGPGINFTQATAANLYTSATVYNWGGGPSGLPDTGTFNTVVKPKYLEVLNATNRETYCDDLTKVFPLSRPWPYPNIRFYNLYKPASGQFFDFRTLLIGIEYINGQPSLYGMVTIIWEP